MKRSRLKKKEHQSFLNLKLTLELTLNGGKVKFCRRFFAVSAQESENCKNH